MARGRPREFDRDDALRRAMELFWRRGYQDTSISALTAEMGIVSPSLYAAFGSKAGLFREAADRYRSDEGAGPGLELEAAACARDAIERMLRANIDLFTRRGGPRGCLLTRAITTCPVEDETVRRYLERASGERVDVLERRLRRARDEGERLPDQDIGALATHYDALVQGLAVRAFEGTSARILHRSVDVAMRAWDAMVGSSL